MTNTKTPPLFLCHRLPWSALLTSSFLPLLSSSFLIILLLTSSSPFSLFITLISLCPRNCSTFSFALFFRSPLPSSSPQDVHPRGRWAEEPWRPWPPIESVIWLNLVPRHLAGSQTGHCWRLWVTGSPFLEKVQFCAKHIGFVGRFWGIAGIYGQTSCFSEATVWSKSKLWT